MNFRRTFRNLLLITTLLLSLFAPHLSWAAISNAGTYSNAAGGKALGANSVTNVTIPTHSIAIVVFHFFGQGNSKIDNVTTLPVLNGVTLTHIASHTSNTQNSAQAFWCTGAGTGSNLTLSYTILSQAFDNGTGISIEFLSGSETASPIRASATDSDDGGGSTSGAMSFQAGDWTIMGYTADATTDQTDGGANTALIAEYTTGGLFAGVYYKTASGTINIGAGSFTTLVAMTVKEAAGGASETAGFYKRRIQ